MEETLTGKSCQAFTAALASAAPVPGGGGAAAMTGALGAALCAMVCSLTLGKKKDEAAAREIRSVLDRSEDLRARLLALVEEDAEAFAPLARAYGIPREDPERPRRLEEATRLACRAPEEMMRLCCQAIELLEVMETRGSPMLLSDVGCGALCCAAALECAGMNVFVNTRTLRDREEAARLDAGADTLLREYLPRARAAADRVAARLREGG